MDRREQTDKAVETMPESERGLTLHRSMMLVTVASMLTVWIIGTVMFSSIRAERAALLGSKADATDLAELRGALQDRATSGDLQKLVGRLEVLEERTARNVQDLIAIRDELREMRAELNETMAWAVTVHKRIREPDDVKEPKP